MCKHIRERIRSELENKEAFYNKYKDNEKLLCKEQTEIWRDEWMCTIEGVNADVYTKEENIKNYNDWLLNYCFGDVI